MYNTDNEIILQAAKQDYEAFYNSEIELRKLQNTPPYSQLLAITASGFNQEHVFERTNFIEMEKRNCKRSFFLQ